MQTGPSPREQGLSALRQGDAATAARLLADAVRADGNDAESWSALGVALCQLGRGADGIPVLQRAVALRPNAAPVQFNLGRALELQGRLPEALASFRRTLELDPAHTGAGEAVRRVEAKGSTGTSSTLGDFVLTPAPAVAPMPVPTPMVPPPPQAGTYAHMRPAPASPFPPGQQSPPLSGYAPPSPRPYSPPSYSAPPYSAPSRPGGRSAPTRSAMSPWAVLGVVVTVILATGGGLVLILAALLLPAMQRAREAAVRVERQQQERAWPNSSAGYVPPASLTPTSPPPTFRSTPQFRPAPMPELPRAHIAAPQIRQYEMPAPRIRQYEIPQPPRFTPPPIPEPPHFTPPSIPTSPSPRMYFPRSFPGGGGPRFRSGPSATDSGGPAPAPGEPTGAPTPGTSDAAPAPGAVN